MKIINKTNPEKENKYDIEKIKKCITDEGRYKVLLTFAEVLDKRSFFSVDGFDIKRKRMNLVVPALAFISDEKIFEEAFLNSVDKTERQVISKIDRMSNVEVDKLAENLHKLLTKGNFDFALKYGKELLCRDREKFIEVISSVALMDNIFLMKPLLVLAFIKINKNDDELLYLVISYLTKARADYSDWENILDTETNFSFDDFNKIDKKSSYKWLGVTAYSKLMSVTNNMNNQKCLNMLSNKIKQLDEKETKEESKIINELIIGVEQWVSKL